MTHAISVIIPRTSSLPAHLYLSADASGTIRGTKPCEPIFEKGSMPTRTYASISSASLTGVGSLVLLLSQRTGGCWPLK